MVVARGGLPTDLANSDPHKCSNKCEFSVVERFIALRRRVGC